MCHVSMMLCWRAKVSEVLREIRIFDNVFILTCHIHRILSQDDFRG